ncbi:MAG: GreA/GreB family elongation factor [Thermoanaerobaculia bacterium]
MTRRTIEEYRAPGSSASLEDDWIAAVEAEPENLLSFLELAQALVASEEEERARGLLELYDAELKSRGLQDTRLELLRRAGLLVVKPNKLQREIVATLEGIWAAKPNFKAILEYVGLNKQADEPAKIWDKVNRLQSLLLYDVGEVVAMASQGVGRVVEVNLPLETLKINFERLNGVTVGFRAAAKMLTPLPPGHLLRRKLEDPEGLAKLRDEQPAELLRAVLEAAGRPLTGAEIRDTLAGIVSEAQWNSWWNAARKHPQVMASSGGRQLYRWEASTAGALASVKKSFDKATPREKLELFRRNADREAKLAGDMAITLAALAGERVESDPAFAFESWSALDRAGRKPDDLKWSIDDLVGPSADLRKLLSGLDDRVLREKALTLLRDRRTDWLAAYRDQFLRETEPRTLNLLATAIGGEVPADLDRLLDDLLSQPRKSPAAFTWLAERAADDEPLRERNPLRLAQQILAALASDDFAPFRSRLRSLTDSGGTLPRLFAHFTQDQATTALETISRTSVLDSFQKESSKNALLLRFPSLREETGTALYATNESIDAKRVELKRLAEVEIPSNRKAIEEARAMGDLRENFEYKSARERHEYLNSRLAALHRDLGRARPIDFANLDTSESRIGTRLVLRSPNGDERKLAVLGPWESKPESGVISYESELGKQLLGKKVGQNLKVGDEPYVLARIESYAPA